MNESEVDERVRAILSRRNPHVEWSAALRLGGGGVGLDSIALVEVLLECEEAFGVSVAGEMLAQEELTVGALVTRLHAAV